MPQLYILDIGMALKKELGQNFLRDQNVVRELADAANLSAGDTVLEVGAGTGTVTAELARRAKKVIAVEFDRDLIPILKEGTANFKNVEVVNEDILKFPIDELANYKVVGSIPYQITSPLIHKVLHSKNRPKSITFIVQKEVAEKITAAPPKATYLSNFVANFGEAKIVKIIKPGAFNPSPKVDSAILHIILYPQPKIADTFQLEKTLHHGFLEQRKMIKHRFPAQALKEAGIPSHERPAHLNHQDWMRLYDVLAKVQERDKGQRGDSFWVAPRG